MTPLTTGKILTAGCIAIGIGLAIKNHKKDGFWLGVAAMFIAGISIKISNNISPESRIGNVDVETPFSEVDK